MTGADLGSFLIGPIAVAIVVASTASPILVA